MDHAEIQMHGERERDRMSGLLPIFRDVGTSQCQFTYYGTFFQLHTIHTASTPQHCHTTPLHLARTYTTPQILTIDHDAQVLSAPCLPYCRNLTR